MAPMALLPGVRATAWTAELAGHGATGRAGPGAGPCPQEGLPVPTPRHGPACRTSPSLPPSASQEQPPAGPIVPSEEGWRRDGSPPEWGVLSPRRVPRGRSPSSLGRRGRGEVPSTLPPGPGWGAGQAPLLESVFIRIYLEQLPTWLSRGAAQLLEKHQGLGISSRNHLVPTDLTLHPLPVPTGARGGSGLAQGGQGLP